MKKLIRKFEEFFKREDGERKNLIDLMVKVIDEFMNKTSPLNRDIDYISSLDPVDFMALSNRMTNYDRFLFGKLFHTVFVDNVEIIRDLINSPNRTLLNATESTFFKITSNYYPTYVGRIKDLKINLVESHLGPFATKELMTDLRCCRKNDVYSMFLFESRRIYVSKRDLSSNGDSNYKYSYLQYYKLELWWACENLFLLDGESVFFQPHLLPRFGHKVRQSEILGCLYFLRDYIVDRRKRKENRAEELRGSLRYLYSHLQVVEVIYEKLDDEINKTLDYLYRKLDESELEFNFNIDLRVKCLEKVDVKYLIYKISSVRFPYSRGCCIHYSLDVFRRDHLEIINKLDLDFTKSQVTRALSKAHIYSGKDGLGSNDILLLIDLISTREVKEKLRSLRIWETKSIVKHIKDTSLSLLFNITRKNGLLYFLEHLNKSSEEEILSDTNISDLTIDSEYSYFLSKKEVELICKGIKNLKAKGNFILSIWYLKFVLNDYSAASIIYNKFKEEYERES